ncbi:hypothetical protein SPRG_12564 [Saprolegnia parasitica CBS 223.65]|uniref:VPS9 domain-containing protein n=1 Tax=Saprolegnia parasitica (strain CBS 223.65) TaxID=695850 RepID=A0A067BVN3_SAPPC|nr:hypothetical protein SPRG_12564 [Saprolegnia parasitica CBS 223.65]KDO22584.1 hypothetical protein SPRG_12564 [Saprolegnia parasitica CBS 223.65]|eukprot:XP_012206700.1 hypothetical protein SPRG_12564 [Saprolegnia parasitica CBS 223.65]
MADRPDDDAYELEAALMDMDQNEVAYLGVPLVHVTLRTLRQRDETTFVLQYRESHEMRHDVIGIVRDAAETRRRGRLERRSSNVFGGLFTSLARVERNPYAQHADEMFLELISAPSTPPRPTTPPRARLFDAVPKTSKVRQHFQQLFQTLPGQRAASLLVKPVQHSLCSVLFEFAEIFHTLYASARSREDAAHAALDVREFGGVLLQVLSFKYPPLQHDASLLEVAAESVEDALFLHLQPTLHNVFAQVYGADDEAWSTKLAHLKALPLDAYDMPHRFQSPCYDDAITVLSALGNARTPSAKVRCVAATCTSIDRCIKRHYASDPSMAVDRLNISADDLPSVLAYVVAQAVATHGHLASYVALMDAFLPPRLEAGEEGYSLAMLHAALTHLESIE